MGGRLRERIALRIQLRCLRGRECFHSRVRWQSASHRRRRTAAVWRSLPSDSSTLAISSRGHRASTGRRVKAASRTASAIRETPPGRGRLRPGVVLAPASYYLTDSVNDRRPRVVRRSTPSASAEVTSGRRPARRGRERVRSNDPASRALLDVVGPGSPWPRAWSARASSRWPARSGLDEHESLRADWSPMGRRHRYRTRAGLL